MLVAEFQQYFFGFSIFISSLFLVMLVLVQRGRGGGLTGALGGAGGQSAFGTKAGDLFTRITVGVAAVWIFLCAAAVFFLRDRALPQTGVDDRDLPAATGTMTPGTPPAINSDLGGSGVDLPADTAPAAATDVPASDLSEPNSATVEPAAADADAAPDAGATPSAPAAEQPDSSAADSAPADSAPADAEAAAPKEGE